MKELQRNKFYIAEYMLHSYKMFTENSFADETSHFNTAIYCDVSNLKCPTIIIF